MVLVVAAQLLLLLPATAEVDLQPLLVAQPHDTKRVPDLKLDFGTSAPPQPPEPPPSRTSEAAAAAAAATEQPPGFWDVIHPVAEKAFFEEFWTRRPLHVVRGRASAVEQHRGQTTKKRVIATEPAPQPYSDLVGSCAIDQLLRGSPTLQMYMREEGTDIGRPGAVPILTLQDGLIRRPLGRGPDSFASVHEAYLSGHTVAIETAEMWFGSINRFCRAMIAYFDYDFTSSLFLTPPDRPTFAPRSTAVDMFILQVRGASKWSLNGTQPTMSTHVSLPRPDPGWTFFSIFYVCSRVRRIAVPGKAKQPYSQHVHTVGDADAVEALSSDKQRADTLFSADLNTGDFLFVPRGWVYSAQSSTKSHSGLLIAFAESERYSIGRLLQVLLGTLAKSVEDNAKSEDPDDIFTRTQVTALTEGLVTKFVTNTLNETDQEWIRMPLPLGARGEGQGLRSLVGLTRSTLETLRDRMKDTTPLCDKGTQGCAGAISTLTGNMPMLQGLTKFVYESAFGRPLTDRTSKLSAQGAQQRRWREQAKQLLCGSTGGADQSMKATGVHNNRGLGLSAELRIIDASKCSADLTGYGAVEEASRGVAATAQAALMDFLARAAKGEGVLQGQGPGVFLVAELPSATDDDMERASVAAMLLDRGCATPTDEQSAYINETCGDTSSTAGVGDNASDAKEL